VSGTMCYLSIGSLTKAYSVFEVLEKKSMAQGRHNSMVKSKDHIGLTRRNFTSSCPIKAMSTLKKNLASGRGFTTSQDHTELIKEKTLNLRKQLHLKKIAA